MVGIFPADRGNVAGGPLINTVTNKTLHTLKKKKKHRRIITMIK